MSYKIKLKRFSPIFAAGILLACATSPTPKDQTAENQRSEAAPPLTNQPTRTQPLSGQTFFELFLAEIAINRGDFGSAASIYRLISEHETDPAVFERAVALNHSIGDYETVRLLGTKWASIAPQSAEPWRALSMAALNLGDFESAEGYLEQWLAVDKKADINLALPHSSQLNKEHTLALVALFESLLDRHPDSHSLLFSLARLNYLSEDMDQAENYVNRAIKAEAALNYRLFRYQVLIKTDKIKQASSLIESLIKSNPTEIEVAVTYARHLYRYEPNNLQPLQALHTRFSSEPIIARTYARVAFEQNELDTAAAIFQHLLEQGFEDEGNYFLGLIHLQNNRPEAAALNFALVESSPYLASALAEWAQLGIESERRALLDALTHARSNDPEQATLYWKIEASYEQQLGLTNKAIEVYHRALQQHPNNVELLYQQALLFATDENFNGLEDNLEKVLSIDPNNFNAMNALGYTWADLNINLPQAQHYIDKALEAQPNNPAFMDSKGWLLYRLGQPDQALDWLTKAYKQLKIDEVAAHIAEVYWSLDNHEQAQLFYQRVAELNPESPFLKKLEALFND